MAHVTHRYHATCNCQHGCSQSAELVEWSCGCLEVQIAGAALHHYDCTDFRALRRACGKPGRPGSLDTHGSVSAEKAARAGTSGIDPVAAVLRVFICHGSQDKGRVREVVNSIRSATVDPWFDEEKLLPGQDWQLEITKAIRQSDVVLVCLSRATCTKSGYVQQEIRHALEVADQQPDGTIFIIPAKLEDCEMPERLNRWQWVVLDSSDGITKLKSALETRARAIGLPAVGGLTFR